MLRKQKSLSKTVIEETMQNKIKEIKFTKTSHKEVLENHPNENVKKVSDPKTELKVLIRAIEELNDKKFTCTHRA